MQRCLRHVVAAFHRIKPAYSQCKKRARLSSPASFSASFPHISVRELNARSRAARSAGGPREKPQGRGRASSIGGPPSEVALATYWLNAERAASRACLNATQVQCTRDWDLRSIMRVSTRHGNTTRLRISLRSAMLPESAMQCLQVRQQRPLVSKYVPAGPKDDRQLEPRRRQAR